MADDDEIDDDLGASSEQKSTKIVSLLLFINIVISGFALFKIMALPSEPVIVNTISADEEEGDEEEKELPGPIHAFEPFLVNLNEPGGGRFLRVTVEVEVVNEEALLTLQSNERQIRDEVLRYLSNLRVEATLGETNRLRIQDGIIARVAPILGEEEVIKRVYLPDFVVQ
jgi:flagellar basal body-associated protein FliL